MNLLKKIKIFKKDDGDVEDTKQGQSRGSKVSVRYIWKWER